MVLKEIRVGLSKTRQKLWKIFGLRGILNNKHFEESIPQIEEI